MPISFDQPHTSLWFDQTVLSAPLPRLNTWGCPLAGEDDRELLVASGPPADLTDQLEQAVASMLSHPDIDLQFTAAVLGTTARTLQRRLAARGSSFSRLLQSLLFRSARELLRDPQMPLTEIAGRLGYADSANFIRAFKRWTGVGPNEFRRLHYQEGPG